MKLVRITGPALAALLGACAANSPHASAPQRAAEQAEADKHAAQEDAVDARSKAQKEQLEAQEATRAQHEAEQKAQWAAQRASLAEAQTSREAKLQQGTGAGATERQADSTAKWAASDITVTFEANSAELSPDAKSKLDRLAERLRAQPKAHDVVVQGYTDDAGPESSNVHLSERRAVTVADYLESKGIARDRMATKALGSLHPVTHENTDRARAVNRRVEVVIEKSK